MVTSYPGSASIGDSRVTSATEVMVAVLAVLELQAVMNKRPTTSKRRASIEIHPGSKSWTDRIERYRATFKGGLQTG
jgi:hypothetical protein